MNKTNRILLVLGLALIGVTGFAMHHLRANQRLGRPGVKTTAIAGSPRLDIYLPPTVLHYDSVDVPTESNLLIYLPHDTSFVTRTYSAPNESGVMLRVVMMGTDRTSIHKPEFCLQGSGWNIDNAESTLDKIHIEKPYPYDLQVMKLVVSREMKIHEQTQMVRGIYVYWFVTENELTAKHTTRMWKTATHLLRTGELERWSYVSCFTMCLPGHEEATYERQKKFISASVPQFQLATGERAQNREPAQTAFR